MKTILFPALIGLYLITSFCGCSDEATSPQQQLPSTFIEATINGIQWRADSSSRVYCNYDPLLGSSSSTTKMEVIGENQLTLLLSIEKPSLGTFILSDKSMTRAALDDNGRTAFNGMKWKSYDSSGVITVTALNNIHRTISGTFVLELENPLAVPDAVIITGRFENVRW